MLAHVGWYANASIVAAIVLCSCLYARGVPVRRRDSSGGRQVAFALGVAAIVVALVSPVDRRAESLASAHMVQHLLLVVVAAPLLVVGAATTTMLNGLPQRLRRPARRLRRFPVVVLLRRRVGLAVGVHVATIWFWHARGPYDAAVRSAVLHALEHVSLFGTASWAWAAVLGVRARRRQQGRAVLLLFVLSAQSAVLGALMTFAREPWYRSYRDTTTAFGMDPLTDQQLAGVIMWVPGCSAYLVGALWLLRAWIGGDATRPRPTASTRGCGPTPHANVSEGDDCSHELKPRVPHGADHLPAARPRAIR